MLFRRIKGTIFFVAACLWLLTGISGRVLAVNHSAVFQQGLSGYTGVRDTWVSTEDWDNPPQYSRNYGQNEALMLLRDGLNNPLLRFDLTSVPANSAIISATLSVYNRTNDSGARRIELFQVLRNWDEGNQVESPVDRSGRHGATGDNAFDYFQGEGTDVPWSQRGMAPGSDYASIRESYVDVSGTGWYNLDMTALAQSWVRGDKANYGIVLRDGSGYSERVMDWREFASSQSTGDATLRPKLTVIYNPDVPLANAGTDQENIRWNGGPVTLNGSGSHDRPGGNDNTLTFAWRVTQAGYGSKMEGQVVSRSKVGTFTPDTRGEWKVTLTVTNGQKESAEDSVHLRLLTIPTGHPRIYLTTSKLNLLKQRATADNPRWVQLKGEADQSDGEMLAKALVSQVTGQASYCDGAVATALGLIASNPYWETAAGDIALVYDWCFGRLNSTQKATFFHYLGKWANQEATSPTGEDSPNWGNYWPRYGYSMAMIGLATYGDDPSAIRWLNEYRIRRYQTIDIPMLDKIADGGGWPEGMIYDWIANSYRVKAIEAWRSATGENLFISTPWFRNRLEYLLLHRWPGIADQFGTKYHPYVSTGDTERNRGSIANYDRIMTQMLIERFPDESAARELQAYLAAPPANNSMSFLFHEEFLWFNPDQPTQQPSLLTHFSRGTGAIFMRSGWPSGAADTDTRVTYLTFQCGDRFTYHQHYDQNSFTLFKGGDLLLDSGVYSEQGTSYHDVNYYVRTIAHNTLVVYNPAEDFSQARPDAVSNDGGQRSFAPATRSPGSVDYWNQHMVHYDTGDMLRFEDAPGYTYALGDASKAYNNPRYNQAMDTQYSGNTGKLNRFHREFIYLRPYSASNDDYVVIFDRVGVTKAAFSGKNTKLLFHTLGEPRVYATGEIISPGETLYRGANLAAAPSAAGGRVYIKTLLPASVNLRKVGGRGVKAFWVFDANYDWHWDRNEPQPRPINDYENVPYGEWRLELEPADTALFHNFLTVLYPTTGNGPMPNATLLTGTGIAGAHILDSSVNRVVVFSSAADGSPPSGTLSYTFRPTAVTLHVLTDLKAGTRYTRTITKNGGDTEVRLVPGAGGTYVVSDQGVLSFTAAP